MTTQGLDAKGYLAGWLSAVTAMTVKDLEALPDDSWTQNFGGCARPANELLADTITNLRWTTGAMKQEESNAYHEMGALTEALTTKELAITTLNQAAEEFAEALHAASDELLNATVMAPWQMPTPLFMLATISVNHIWYHDGQINYIHGLLGDEKVYWMG